MALKKRIAIMQPYFFPYLGYWQLISCVDTFVIYDDIQFTKKGWIHRNRFLNNASDQMFSLPLKKDSDYLDVRDRFLSDSWDSEKIKLKRKIEGAYRKSPYFNEGMAIFDECLDFDSRNLFEFIYNSIKIISHCLGLGEKFLISSEIDATKHLKGQDRVVAICEKLGAKDYINPIGGQELYQREHFSARGISLKFHKMGDLKYQQMSNDFISHLSILDLLMFIGVDGIRRELNNYELKE